MVIVNNDKIPQKQLCFQDKRNFLEIFLENFSRHFIVVQAHRFHYQIGSG